MRDLNSSFSCSVDFLVGRWEKVTNYISKEKIEADVEVQLQRFPALSCGSSNPRPRSSSSIGEKWSSRALRHASEAKTVVDTVIKRIKMAKIDISNPRITIQNIVASGDLHTLIDLNIAAVVMDNAMYESEVFPELIYRIQDPKTVFLIFSTGRIVCTSGKTKEIVAQAVRKLHQEVKKYGVAKYEGEEFNEDTFY